MASIPKTITKKDLIDRIADSSEVTRQQARQVIHRFLDEVIAEIGKGNRLEFRDFGVFECRLRAARIAQNPKTMERVPVRAKYTIKFKTGRLMQEALDALGRQEDALVAARREAAGLNGGESDAVGSDAPAGKA